MSKPDSPWIPALEWSWQFLDLGSEPITLGRHGVEELQPRMNRNRTAEKKAERRRQKRNRKVQRQQSNQRGALDETFERAERQFEEFERLLGTVGISSAPGSTLEDSHLTITRLRAIKRGQEANEGLNSDLPVVQQCLGVHRIVKMILRIRDHGDFDQLVPHLRMLASSTGSLAQNVRSPVADGESRLLFELLAAAAVMRCSSNVLVEDPGEYATNNPDVLFDYRGVRWGIACKVLNTAQPKTILQRIREGADQIEASAAQRGLVLLNLRNLFDYDSLIPSIEGDDGPMYMIPEDPLEAPSQLRRTCLEHIQGIDEKVGGAGWIEAFAGSNADPVAPVLRKTVPIVSVYAELLTFVKRAEGSSISPFAGLIPVPVGDIQVDDHTDALLRDLDAAVQLRRTA